MTRRPVTPLPVLVLMTAILKGHTATPGGACVGQAPRWDPEVDGETAAEQSARLTEAREGCLSCPERSVCPSPVLRVPRGC